MGLVLAFAELGGGLLLLAAGITGATFRQVITGHAAQIYQTGSMTGSSAGSAGAVTAPADTANPGAGITLNVGNLANATGNELAAINPVRAKSLVIERIDQGQDFADQGGTIVSPEPGKIVAVTPVGAGWEGGGAVVEQLSSGADLYFEEGVAPIRELLGRTVAAGQTIADLIPGFHSGVEAGYAAPTTDPGANYIGDGYETLAQATTGYTEGEQTPAGRQFAAWLQSVGF